MYGTISTLNVKTIIAIRVLSTLNTIKLEVSSLTYNLNTNIYLTDEPKKMGHYVAGVGIKI